MLSFPMRTIAFAQRPEPLGSPYLCLMEEMFRDTVGKIRAALEKHTDLKFSSITFA